MEEAHAFITIDANNDTFEAQAKRMDAAQEMLYQLPELEGANPIFKRYFLTDATNQVPFMKEDRFLHSATSSQWFENNTMGVSSKRYARKHGGRNSHQRAQWLSPSLDNGTAKSRG